MNKDKLLSSVIAVAIYGAGYALFSNFGIDLGPVYWLANIAYLGYHYRSV